VSSDQRPLQSYWSTTRSPSHAHQSLASRSSGAIAMRGDGVKVTTVDRSLKVIQPPVARVRDGWLQGGAVTAPGLKLKQTQRPQFNDNEATVGELADSGRLIDAGQGVEAGACGQEACRLSPVMAAQPGLQCADQDNTERSSGAVRRIQGSDRSGRSGKKRLTPQGPQSSSGPGSASHAIFSLPRT
jgi:hypothetical protein